MPKLSPDQCDALNAVRDWWSDRPVRRTCTLGGYAGTGKTTLIKYLLEEFSRRSLSATVVSLTGKACSVLQSKGVSASTIHSYLYIPSTTPDGELVFTRNPETPHYDLIINDEASMTSAALAADLEEMGRVLYVGDHGQLPPVNSDFNPMLDPEIELTQIHRQAASSPIITTSEHIRSNRLPKPLISDELVVRRNVLDARTQMIQSYCADEFDIVICGKNDTRRNINSSVRSIQEHDHSPLVVGEQIIFLHNAPGLGIYNGLTATVSEIHTQGRYCWTADVTTSEGVLLRNLDIDLAILDDDSGMSRFFSRRSPGSRRVACTYAYAVTCHKAQGSEWPRVGIIGEKVWKTNFSRWLYTALTRAQTHATLLLQ